MCATHNVTPSTLYVIKKELRRGLEVATDILTANRPWKDLFERHTFFTRDYKYYLSIIAASRTKEANSIWSGYVNSRLRRLVTGIEQSGAGVALAQPYMKGWDRVHQVKEADVDRVLQGDMSFQAKDIEAKNTDDSKDIKRTVAAEDGTNTRLEMPTANGIEKPIDPETLLKIWTTTFYIGIGLEEGDYSEQTTIDETDSVNDRCQVVGHIISGQ